METPGDYIPVPSTAEVGQTIVVKAVDENGKPTAWEAVDMLDVKMNGESIVQDGVANIPELSSDNYGVAKYVSGYGLTNVKGRGLCVDTASNSTIDHRYNYSPITAKNLDYAVKSAMCDGKDAAWTAEEQAAARERIGSKGVYRHIATITIETNDNKYITIESDDNGNTFSLNEVCIFTYSPITDDTTANNGYFMFNYTGSLFGSYRLKGDASKPTYNMAILYCGGIKPVMLFSTDGSRGEIASSGLLSQSFGSEINTRFEAVSRIFCHGNGTVPSGTIFEIWWG